MSAPAARRAAFKPGAAPTIAAILAVAALSTGLPSARAQPPGPASGAPAPAPAPAPPPPDTTVLTLIGTQGGPGLTVQRAGESSLLTVRGKRYLIDAGIGSTRRLTEAKVTLPSLSVIFITHLHNDHTADLPGLLAIYAKRGPPLEIIGPPRTADFVAGVRNILRINAEIRAEQGGQPVADAEAMYTARDVQPGLVYSDDLVKVTAKENAHFHFQAGSKASPNKSYAYRFQTPHKVVVFTGDTGVDPGLAKFAEGADILVCEMVSARVGKAAAGPGRFHMVEEHLSPTQVGQLARDAKVKQLVLSHLVGADPEDIDEIKKWYSGPVTVGEDLQVFN
jgi:ribonuclease BN (tRNA processing enzyme)